MRGVKAPTAATKAPSRGLARRATSWALVVLTTRGQCARAASASSTRRACSPRLRACATSASALAGLREATHTSRTPRPSANASRWARPCTPAPTTSRGPSVWRASRRAASSDTAAVRRAVTVGPSSRASLRPSRASNTTMSPWMPGSPRAGLSATKVMSLVMATCASAAGITNRLPPCASGWTMRGGTATCGSRSTASIALASCG